MAACARASGARRGRGPSGRPCRRGSRESASGTRRSPVRRYRLAFAAMNPKALLAGLRSVIGVSAWVAPDLSGRLFGLDPAGNPQASYLARLFGVRDLALAVGLQNAEGDAGKLWLQAGIACDVADAAAGVLAGRGGRISPFATVLVTGAALSAAAMGVAALRDDAAAADAPR